MATLLRGAPERGDAVRCRWRQSELFGFQFDSGDVNKYVRLGGPVVSDLLVGSFNGKRAYLYLGAAGTVSDRA